MKERITSGMYGQRENRDVCRRFERVQFVCSSRESEILFHEFQRHLGPIIHYLRLNFSGRMRSVK